MDKKNQDPISSERQKEIVSQYLKELELHLSELKSGKVENTFEIKDFAAILCIHPTHLSNTIQQVVGKSPCEIYEEGLIEISKQLIVETQKPIAHIAQMLTYDPSNFSKFFKSYVGSTPKKYRVSFQKEFQHKTI
jgi:AraC-like DNA-binding protein